MATKPLPKTSVSRRAYKIREQFSNVSLRGYLLDFLRSVALLALPGILSSGGPLLDPPLDVIGIFTQVSFSDVGVESSHYMNLPVRGSAGYTA